MLERLDEDARTVFTRAREKARALGRDCVDTEHVLLGVCHQDEGDSDPFSYVRSAKAASATARPHGYRPNRW
jgi:hypothetical protein